MSYGLYMTYTALYPIITYNVFRWSVLEWMRKDSEERERRYSSSSKSAMRDGLDFDVDNISQPTRNSYQAVSDCRSSQRTYNDVYFLCCVGQDRRHTSHEVVRWLLSKSSILSLTTVM